MAACKVELVKGANKKGSGWILRGSQGQIVRRFFDSNDDNKIDVWSYYDKDGNEVYRETDSDFDGRPDQYRWLNAGGMKLGIDDNEDGKIDTWKMISPEEVSQEIVRACVTHDYARLRALMISETEIKALDLPASEASRIRDLQAKAAARFQSVLGQLPNFSDKTQWVHLETQPPRCVPAEPNSGVRDRIQYQRGTVLCDTAGKNDWLQTGPMIQVGMAWRIIDVPGVGADDGPAVTDGKGNPVASADPELQKFIAQLKELDTRLPKGSALQNNGPEMSRYHLQRADLLEQIIAKDAAANREMWIRQLADCLSAASQSSSDDNPVALERLKRLEEQIVRAMPGSNLAAFVSFRVISADYAAHLNKSKDFNKVQQDWLDTLTKFVQTYPRADDTPDALLQLGMVSEMLGKESEAKKAYELLVQNFPDAPQAVKSRGAVRRLEAEGKVLELTGPMLTSGAAFDIARLRDKIVIVYYWASWNQQSLGDFAKLKLLLDTYKGVELVCVNLDNTAEEASTFLRRSPAPGVHLFQGNGAASGLESPLATQYGIMVLPNLFLVGRDGKVVNRTVQINGLEDEVKKLVK